MIAKVLKSLAGKNQANKCGSGTLFLAAEVFQKIRSKLNAACQSSTKRILKKELSSFFLLMTFLDNCSLINLFSICASSGAAKVHNEKTV